MLWHANRSGAAAPARSQFGVDLLPHRRLNNRGLFALDTADPDKARNSRLYWGTDAFFLLRMRIGIIALVLVSSRHIRAQARGQQSAPVSATQLPLSGLQNGE